MATIGYQKLQDLTAEEKEAAEAYAAESGFFHLTYQGAHDAALDGYHAYQHFAGSGRARALAKATSERYELTTSATLYSGHGNDATVFGGFAANDPRCFVGMTWQYKGVISTSEEIQVAEDFMIARASLKPTLMIFELCPGFRLLPMQELQSGHEMEYLLPYKMVFRIVEAKTSILRGSSHAVLKFQPA